MNWWPVSAPLLREAADSDLLLIVADASRADFEEQRSVVAETLHNIGAANVPGIMVIKIIKFDLQQRMLGHKFCAAFRRPLHLV